MLLLTSLLLASSALAVGPVHPARKSLSFGPTHPSAKLTRPPIPIPLSAFSPRSVAEPRELAAEFVRGLHGEEVQFLVREDSYDDKNTGVSHVYLRQVVGGLEVMDGDINVNIRDGHVISYGDSFYTGEVPDGVDPSLQEEPTHDQLAYCEAISTQLAALLPAHPSGGQVPLGGAHDSADSDDTDFLRLLHAHNCRSPTFPSDESSRDPSNVVDPTVSALNFMLLAAPTDEDASALQAEYSTHLANMASSLSVTHHFSSAVPEISIAHVPHTTAPVRARLAYVQTPSPSSPTRTTLNLIWHLLISMPDNAYEASMSATRASRLISVVDWVSDAYVPIPKPGTPKAEPVYNVWAWGINDPTGGNRTLEKGYDKTASPAGWHAIPSAHNPGSGDDDDVTAPTHKDDPVLNFTTTWGNNVFAQENLEGRNDWLDNYRPDAGASEGLFDFPWLPEENNTNTSPREYLNLSVTQLFYTSNMIHDLYYRYGFDEVAGNFQQYNFGKGGRENDAVITNAQDGSGFNNANFMTPPDGSNGRMRMYVWNTARPWRDGDLEAGIVIHEYSHGLSTRLTGGPANSACLGWGEAGGMGEGWGDFIATTVRSSERYKDYGMGDWAANRPSGIRNYVYSLNLTLNPSTYKTLDKPGYWGVHAIGEVWAEILWVMSNRLISVHGFSSTLFPPEALPNGTIPAGDFYRPQSFSPVTGEPLPLIPIHGNSLALQLVINAMKLQPCRPSFFDAREAIIQADTILTGGENECELWKGFAERGLGWNATLKGGTPWGGGVRTDDFTLPVGLCDSA